MADITARDAVEYAFSREMLRLYGVLLIGDVTVLSGGWLLGNWAVRGGTAGLIGQALGTLLLMAGLLIGIGGFIGIIYKIIADANSRATESA